MKHLNKFLGLFIFLFPATHVSAEIITDCDFICTWGFVDGLLVQNCRLVCNTLDETSPDIGDPSPPGPGGSGGSGVPGGSGGGTLPDSTPECTGSANILQYKMNALGESAATAAAGGEIHSITICGSKHREISPLRFRSRKIR